MSTDRERMTPLTFTKNGSLLVAVEAPHRYVLRRDKINWVGEIFDIKGRRTPKMSGHFTSRKDAIKWLQSYRVG